MPLYSDCGWLPFGLNKTEATNVCNEFCQVSQASADTCGIESCGIGSSLIDGSCQVNQSCATGTAFNSENGRCEVSQNCATGTEFISANGRCEVSQSCATGTAFNSANGRCEVTTDCGIGSTFNSMIGKCEVSQDCATGTAFNSANGRCEVSQDCATGTAFNSANGRCDVNQSCATGTEFNSANGRCEVSQSCATGTEFNSANGRCEVSQSCASGTAFNSANGRCEVTTDCGIGSTFNSVNGRCEVNDDCAAGTVFVPANGRCEVGIQGINYNPHFSHLVYSGPNPVPDSSSSHTYKIFALHPQGTTTYGTPSQSEKYIIWLQGVEGHPGVTSTLGQQVGALVSNCNDDPTNCPMLPSGSTESTCTSSTSSHSYFDTVDQKCYHEVLRSSHAIIYTDQINTSSYSTIPDILDILENMLDAVGECVRETDMPMSWLQSCIHGVGSNINVVI